MYDRLSYTNSDELCEQMSRECNTILLSFSGGKDSVASWLQCRKYFKNIIPFYRELVPNLKFVEEDLKYYEDFFGQHIYRFPSPNFYRMLRDGIFQDHQRWVAICSMKREWPQKDFTDTALADLVRMYGGLSDNVYCGVGNRMTDSPMRRMALSKSGAVNHTKKIFYPVYDWSHGRLLKELDESGVKLSVDYNLWSNTFDSLSYKYLSKMRDVFPEDYEKILKAFPMAKLEFMRRGEEF